MTTHNNNNCRKKAHDISLSGFRVYLRVELSRKQTQSFESFISNFAYKMRWLIAASFTTQHHYLPSEGSVTEANNTSVKGGVSV